MILLYQKNGNLQQKYVALIWNKVYIVGVPHIWHERKVNKMDRYTPAQARRLRKISQAKMASLLGMSENTYINKEKGDTKFYIDEACKFSNIVEIPLENLIFFNEDVPN